MYIWDADALMNQLTDGALPENEAFKYLMANTIMISLVLIPFPENNINDIIGAIVDLVVAILGVIYIYKCNGGEKGKEIIQRYISLGFVIAIRYLVQVGLPAIILLYTAMAYYAEVPDQTSLFEVVFYALLGAGYFWKLGAYFTELNNNKLSNNLMERDAK